MNICTALGRQELERKKRQALPILLECSEINKQCIYFILFIDNYNAHSYVLHIYGFSEHYLLYKTCNKHHTDIQGNLHGLPQHGSKCLFSLLMFYNNHYTATRHWYSCSSWN